PLTDPPGDEFEDLALAVGKLVHKVQIYVPFDGNASGSCSGARGAMKVHPLSVVSASQSWKA
ncbi:MAG TPA: hypothetical protein VFI81_05175, partial [Rhodanobacteraceae bacterium]|nr:hypothetical protein [Rhodanobacteraceae bacterium]